MGFLLHWRLLAIPFFGRILDAYCVVPRDDGGEGPFSRKTRRGSGHPVLPSGGSIYPMPPLGVLEGKIPLVRHPSQRCRFLTVGDKPGLRVDALLCRARMYVGCALFRAVGNSRCVHPLEENG